MKFTRYIWCLVLRDLVTLTLFLLLCLIPDPHHTPTLIILRLWVIDFCYELLNLITFPLAVSRLQSLRMRRVTWPITEGRQKWSTFLKFLIEIYLFTLSFQGAKIKPCYRWQIAFFPFCEGYRVHCACAVSRDLCIGGPPKPHVTIFRPRIVYSPYNFYGTTTTIKWVSE